MNVALILAGGTDPKFQMNVPKQFVNVNDRPVIVYTLEVFQNHPAIDMIIVSCLNGWQEMVRAYAKQFKISKLEKIVQGGLFGQDSSYNGIIALEEICRKGDIIVVHDAIRPLVSQQMVSNSIQVCRENGMGVAAVNSMDTIMRLGEGRTGVQSINRYEVMRIQTPQSYEYELLKNSHEEAIEREIRNQFDVNSMMSALGKTIYFSQGSDLNLKINTIEDIEMFRVLYRMKENT